jgi:hypothetical protein
MGEEKTRSGRVRMCGGMPVPRRKRAASLVKLLQFQRMRSFSMGQVKGFQALEKGREQT